MRIIKSIIAVVFLAGVMVAQDAPKAEFFAGYQFTHVSKLRDVGVKSFTTNGFTTSLAFNPNRVFGVVGDFGLGHGNISGIGVNLITAMVGPEVSYRGEHARVFGHGLVGVGHVSASLAGFSASSNALAYGGGGGVDISAGKHVAFRAVQLDYIHTSLNNSAFLGSFHPGIGMLRLSVGVVFK